MKITYDTSICIVGAGASGLTAAYYLKKRGYTNVTVLEKEDRVGGKCESIEYPKNSGRFVDMAASEMSQGYTNVTRLARELGVPTTGDQSLRIYDRKNPAYLTPLQASKELERVSFMSSMWASIRYTWLILTRYGRFSRAASGLANAPDELKVPLGTWSRKSRLQALSLNYSYTMQVGYGRPDNLTAAYFIKFQNLLNWYSNLLSVLGISRRWPRYFRDGFQSLWNTASRELDVELNTKITSVKRIMQDDDVVIEMNIEGEDDARYFDQLILCCPLDLESVSFLDVTEQERALFSQIRYVDYISTACEMRGIPEGITITFPLPWEGDPTGSITKSVNPGVSVFFTIASVNETFSEALERIKTSVTRLPRWKGEKPELVSVVKQSRWKFFPHVTPEQFAGGYFERFEALQGHRNTLYMSSILSMETVEDAVGYSRNKVFEQFPDLTKRYLWYVVLEAAILFGVLIASRIAWA